MSVILVKVVLYDMQILSNVYDGERYQALLKNGFLSNPYNLSLIWHTDGVSVFKSSGIQAWLVQSTVCKLPQNLR